MGGRRQSVLRRGGALLALLVIVFLLAELVLRGSALVGAFVGPSTISIDGVFTDWGTTSSPTSGVAVSQDASNSGASDGSGISDATDIANFWAAISSQNGGTTHVSPSNKIQNYPFRVDTACDTSNGGCKSSSAWVINQAYSIQLNLGVAAAGKADHLLQIYAQTNSSTPQVVLILFEYSSSPAYPDMGAFTTGAITGKVSNTSNPYAAFSGTVDSTATGAVGVVGSTYSLESKVPSSWFSSTYGGLVTDDGTGAGSVVLTVFTSTGTLGAVGTVKDTVNDSGGAV